MTVRSKIIPVFVPHWGCPHHCVFCNQQRITGRKAPAAAENVVAAIEAAEGQWPAQLAFYGGSFTAVPETQQEELLGAVQPYIDDGRIELVRLSTRPDCIDERTLDRLKRYRVGIVELGCQSMCPEVLEAAGRGHTAEDTRRAAGMIKTAGFQLILQMMTGLPGDSLERTVQTAKELIALKPDGVRIYPTVIIRDTEMYDRWLKGEYREHTVEEATEWCSEIVPLFNAAEIPIIRLGLNPTDELSHGGAVGGAYHPALGELVYSRIFLKRAAVLLEPYRGAGEAVICVAPSEVSKMTGQKRCNIVRLESELGIGHICVRGVPEQPRGEITVLAENTEV